MLLQIYSNFSESGQLIKAMFNGVNTVLPGFPPEDTGSQYHSITFVTPAATMAWMIIDIIFDRRTQYFRPLEREKKYRRSMYKFSIKVIINRQIEKIQHRLKEKQAEKDEEEAKKKQAIY